MERRYKSMDDITNQVRRLQAVPNITRQRSVHIANIGAEYTNNMYEAPGGTFRAQKRKYARWQTFPNRNVKFPRSTYMGAKK